MQGMATGPSKNDGHPVAHDWTTLLLTCMQRSSKLYVELKNGGCLPANGSRAAPVSILDEPQPKQHVGIITHHLVCTATENTF